MERAGPEGSRSFLGPRSSRFERPNPSEVCSMSAGLTGNQRSRSSALPHAAVMLGDGGFVVLGGAP
eukprot:13540860-Alexandrium_andersonii.AAC.1